MGYGWSKKDVQRYIHQNSHLPVVLGDRGGRKLDEKMIINGNYSHNPLTHKM
jgi:hypothetical protein